MATSHGSKDDFPLEEMGDYKGQMSELPDGYTVNFESIPAGMGGPELFKGLPEDACHSPHWGYLFKGKFKATYTDGREDVVSLEFSPTDEWRQTMEQVSKNVESMR